MRATHRYREWTDGDPISSALLDLAADRGLPTGIPITTGLVELAQRHGLVGILADYTEDRLTRAIHARESARRAILEKHLGRILERLHGAGIKAAVLKGPAIADRYRLPKHRPFSDIDLLVPVDQLEVALELISSDEAVIRVPAKKPRADKRDILFADASGVRFNVDLHWDLFSYTQLRGAAEGATDEAWGMADERPVTSLGPVWEIPDAPRLAFLASHAVLDHRFRLILFRDFLELARSGIDWSHLEQVASRWGLRSTTFLALWMSKRALGVPVPDDFLGAIRPRSAPLRYLQWALPRTDLVRFDGHTPHPINLAAVLLNDSPRGRFSLLLRAPSALPGWRRRVSAEVAQPDRPRTLIVVSTDRRRGAEVFTERLRDGLTTRGWVVEAVCLHGTGEVPRADVEVLVDRAAGGRSRFDWEVLKALRAKIKTFKPDLLVANGGATLRYGLPARLGMGCRLVYMGIGEPHYWIRSRLSHWLNRIMLRSTNRVLAVSETTKDQLLELEPRLRDKIDVGYTGIPEEMFQVKSADPTGPLRLLMVGSLAREKDPIIAVRAVARVERSVIRFVGDGPLMNEIERHAELLGITDRVDLVGSVPDVTPHLEWAHLLVLTSLSEGLPGAILEAGAAGVPAVSLDVGGVREAIIDGESGMVVADEDELVSAIQYLESDRDRLAAMGEAARKHISLNFALGDVIDRYAGFLMGTWR